MWQSVDNNCDIKLNDININTESASDKQKTNDNVAEGRRDIKTKLFTHGSSVSTTMTLDGKIVRSNSSKLFDTLMVLPMLFIASIIRYTF